MNKLITIILCLLFGAGGIYWIIRMAMKEEYNIPIKKKKRWEPK